MNDKPKVTNLFKRAEETPRDYSLAEIGVSGVPEPEKLQIIHTMDETLARAEEILDEAA